MEARNNIRCVLSILSKGKNTVIPLPLSRSSTEAHPSVTIGMEIGVRGKLRFNPLIDYLSHTQLLAIFRFFIKAIRERKATRVYAMGRLIVAISAYDPVARTGGFIRLTIDDAWVEIHPVDFLTVLLGSIGPGDPPYTEIMDALLTYALAGTGTLEERANACLQSLATTAPTSASS